MKCEIDVNFSDYTASDLLCMYVMQFFKGFGVVDGSNITVKPLPSSFFMH